MGKYTHCDSRRCATGALGKRGLLPRFHAEGRRCHGCVVGAAYPIDLRSSWMTTGRERHRKPEWEWFFLRVGAV